MKKKLSGPSDLHPHAISEATREQLSDFVKTFFLSLPPRSTSTDEPQPGKPDPRQHPIASRRMTWDEACDAWGHIDEALRRLIEVQLWNGLTEDPDNMLALLRSWSRVRNEVQDHLDEARETWDEVDP